MHRDGTSRTRPIATVGTEGTTSAPVSHAAAQGKPSHMWHGRASGSITGIPASMPEVSVNTDACGHSSAGQIGDYALHYLKVPGTPSVSAGDEGGLLTSGAAHAGTIGIGDLDAYQIDLGIGDSLVLHAADFAAVEHEATVPGIFTVALSDGTTGAGQAGDYLLYAARLPGSFEVPAGDEGGILANSVTHPGFIGPCIGYLT